MNFEQCRLRVGVLPAWHEGMLDGMTEAPAVKRTMPDAGTPRRKEISTEAARVWRFRAAERRIRKILDGSPPLTSQMRAELAAILCPDDAA